MRSAGRLSVRRCAWRTVRSKRARHADDDQEPSRREPEAVPTESRRRPSHRRKVAVSCWSGSTASPLNLNWDGTT